MKISEFILLDEPEMKATVLHEGVLIGKRNDAGSLMFLFQMNDYYVETCFNMQNKAVREYRVFQNINYLAPYLEAIAIDDLLP